MTTGEAHSETRRMMETAIRRLNALEYVILAVAMALALVAGALSAWMVESLVGAPFRLAWAVSSLLFFVVPGWVVLRRERQVKEGEEGNSGTVGIVPTGSSDDFMHEANDGGR